MRIEGNDLRLAAATAIQMQNTGADKIVAPKTTQQKETLNLKSDETVQSLAGDRVSIKVDLPKNTVDTLQKMGNLSDFLNSVATSIRQTSEGLKATSGVVEDMKTSLDNIIKTYPPYSIESKERIAQLMTYAALKKQIISLMVPAPPTPIYEKVQHLWEDLFSGQNGTIQTPTLPLDVPDSHIKAAAGQLDNLSSQVGLLQDALGNSVSRG
jgi:hypothetical protein